MTLPAMTERERDPHGLCGTTIADKFRVERVVGFGGFGVVYRGVHLAFGEPIAIKCLHVAEGLGPEERGALLERLQEEGAVLHRLSKRSSTIVQALDVGALETQAGRWLPYLVLEWIEGETLATWLAERRRRGARRLAPSEAIGLLEPVARALALAHRQRIAHRDVKPENIMLVCVEGATLPKLLDFGIAKVLAEHARFTASPAATQQKSAVLTPEYGAPEQFDKRRGATGPWTDVFALALILVELLIGQRALEGDDPLQLYVSSANPDGRPTPRQRGVAVDDALEQALTRALAIDPQDRYQDAGAMWDAIEQAMGAAPGATADAGAACPTSHFVASSGLDVGASPSSDSAATAPAPVSVSGELPTCAAPTMDDLLPPTRPSEREAAGAGPIPAAEPIAKDGTGPRAAGSRAPGESAIIALASSGTLLTVANVVAHLGLEPADAEATLDRMVEQGRLDCCLDAAIDLPVYTVPGLTITAPAPSRTARLLAAGTTVLQWLAIDPAREPTLAPEKRKSVPLGVALGALFPGLGLLYAAPLRSALILLVLGAIAVSIAGQVPLLGYVLGAIASIVAALVSGLLGGAYVWHYNRAGKRTALRTVRGKPLA